MTNIKNPNEYPKMLHFAFNALCHETLSTLEFDPLEFEIRSLEICDSTNDYVIKLLETQNNAIVLSMVQETGRGRESRFWHSPMGGVWMSIGINTSSKVVELSGPVIAAIKQALDPFILSEIKAPNDLLVEGKKICGVLVETKSIGDHFERVIIGIGINVFNKIPDEIAEIATRLSDHCDPPSVPEVANLVVKAVMEKIKKLVYV